MNKKPASLSGTHVDDGKKLGKKMKKKGECCGHNGIFCRIKKKLGLLKSNKEKK